MKGAAKNDTIRRAVELIAGEVPAILSSWKHTREMPDLRAEDAVDLLVAWAHLHRFDPKYLPENLWERISTAIDTDGAMLVRCVPEALDAAGWVPAMRNLKEQVDEAVTDEECQAADAEALLLFQQLDDAELALWGARRIQRDQGMAHSETLARFEEALATCWAEFMVNLGVFFGVDAYASGLLRAYREDLLGYDVELWSTIDKYKILVRTSSELSPSTDAMEPISEEQWLALCEASPPNREALAAARVTRGFGALGAEADVMFRRRIDYEAEDGSWKAFLTVPTTPDWDSKASLWITDRTGAPISEAEVVLFGVRLTVSEGHGEVDFGRLWRAWKAGPVESPIILSRAGVETRGQRKAEGGGPTDVQGG
jgi:hypothetical protein